MVNFFIKTYGCQANVADSAHIEKYLVGLGCRPVSEEQDADLIIVNTCAIRKKAEDKIFSYIGSLAPLRGDKPHLKLCVIGCIASYRKKELFSRFPHVNALFGAREDLELFKSFLGDAMQKLERGREIAVANDRGPIMRRSMINIMRGCNNYCSYCIVPFTTGRERSFAMSRILESIKKDIEGGVKEITLLGQNVNSYKDPETGARFEELMARVAQLDGDFWVRFVSPHPKDMTTELIDVIREHNDKLCSYIHLPLQSGSDRILRAMHRTYTSGQYLTLVDEIRKRLPHATITTDIIVGFPGETEDDYRATREMMERVRYQMIFSFLYSPRKYTKAALMKDDCPLEVKQERLAALQARHREIGSEENKKLIGKNMRVLLEKRCDDGSYLGRTEGNVRVFVTGEDLQQNTFVHVAIEKARLSDLQGSIKLLSD